MPLTTQKLVNFLYILKKQNFLEFDDIMNDKDAHIYKLDSLNSEEIA